MVKKFISLGVAVMLLLSLAGLSACEVIVVARYKGTTKIKLDDYVAALSPDDYSEENWEKITDFVTEGNKAIDTAYDEKSIDKALASAKEKINEVPTKLAEYKNAAKAMLDAYVAALREADYSEENWKKITGFVTDGKAAIDGAHDKNSIDQALAEAREKIDGVVTALAARRALKSAELDAHFATKSQADYSDRNWEGILGFYDSGKTGINVAKSPTDVDIAFAAAKDGMDETPLRAKLIVDDMESLELQMGKDFVKYQGWRDDTEIPPILKHYGVYGECVVVRFNCGAGHLTTKVEVGGVVIIFNDNNTAKAWKDGVIYTLKQAYEQEFLTKWDLQCIAEIQNNSPATPFPY